MTIQASLATVLLLMAALCARTLWNASQVSYGFDGKQVQAFSLKPDRNNYPDQQAVMTMADALVRTAQGSGRKHWDRPAINLAAAFRETGICRPAASIRGISSGVRAYGPNYQMPPIVWIPFSPRTATLHDVWRDSDSLFFALKVQGNPAASQEQVIAAVREIAPTRSVGRLQPMSEYQSANLSRQRLNLALILVFAAVALLLSSVGMYSVMAVSVGSRQHELGIRAALGARPNKLMSDVLLQGGIQVGAGLIVGLVVALMASRLVQRFLFGVTAADPLSVFLVLVVLSFAGLFACLGPAIRAARVHPMRALRVE